jgi:ATP-dependent Clp protease ATP-binding subunit ClpC
LALFTEAANAGNTIIAIENISSVIREAEQAGVYLPELLDEFLAFPGLHIIATDTPAGYHNTLEPLGAFTRRFSEILLDTADRGATTRVLEGVALTTELQQHVIFTYEGLEAITSAADRYLVEGVMPDKAITLLIEVAAAATRREQILITSDLVYQVVSEKTNVPAGPIKDTEREQLLNLETILHQQVIGQDQAIAAIASTMRRARAGIQAEDKPIGSFLFLGPTGVGKTETAKALAKVFFGSGDKMERLDMSEFSGPDALERLIGDGQNSGELSDRLREHPYTVLLLDEFEKAATTVHDLFLQILDEGIFTDGRGSTVNARNTIIIATSNAGADLIMKTVAERRELSHLTHEIIDNIIARGIYRPELINRFDNTIIFEPLSPTQQNQVANLMLSDLYSRIKDRGYRVQIGQDLIDILVQKGYDPQFGARPMQRVIQDILEEKIASLIISGKLQKGDLVTLTAADFTAEELQK